MVAGDELAYYVDLQLFLGNSMQSVADSAAQLQKSADDWHNLIGRVPQWVNDEYEEQLRKWTETSLDLQASVQIKENGYKQYLKSRPGASVESVKRVRALKGVDFGPHPLLASSSKGSVEDLEEKRQSIIDQVWSLTELFSVRNLYCNQLWIIWHFSEVACYGSPFL